MGRAIEEIALERGHEISLRYSLEDIPENWKEQLSHSDVAIEFTAPDAAIENIQHCFDLNVPIVVGTTGWYHLFESVAVDCRRKNQSLLYATNFSIGVNLFFELNNQLAKLMGNFPEYAASMEEIHHVHKKDAPSGTAITLAEGLIQNHPQYSAWENITETNPETLSIVSIREDEVPGTHTIRYTSEIDQIEIKHIAFNRKGFAMGAVLAAEFLKGKKGVFNMNDMLKK